MFYRKLIYKNEGKQTNKRQGGNRIMEQKQANLQDFWHVSVTLFKTFRVETNTAATISSFVCF